ncbi:hypothetical protein GGQ92_000738 [Gracilibacillus halotolerans]|uniref:Uncharacterized protein n=1 Tax=Gracilibacillus halotolerans TaxID=74386 RepID=A0A841RH47_9BACI|nr:hypothetical protein [Gracilibacillus halotolerans]MBB6511971.1 hypothetical protein [Gracilibacillus halotolerans]
MGRYYRYRLPLWCRECLFILERSLLPIIIFQAIRTLFIPTSFDIIILSILIGVYISFRLHWI